MANGQTGFGFPRYVPVQLENAILRFLKTAVKNDKTPQHIENVKRRGDLKLAISIVLTSFNVTLDQGCHIANKSIEKLYLLIKKFNFKNFHFKNTVEESN